MINRPVTWLFTLLLLLSGLMVSDAQSEPQQPIQRLVLRETDNQAELLSLDADGSVRVVAALEDVGFGSQLGVEWEVPIVIDVVPSPDGARVAFTAFASRGAEAVLFVVSLNPLRIQKFDAPGVASLEWSPSSDALLLTRESFYLGGELATLPAGEIYIFDLANEAFTLVAQNSVATWVRDAVWSPDGERVILNIHNVAGPLDLHIADLHIVNRDGTNRQQLTNLREEAPQSIDFTQPSQRNLCDISDIEWSASIERLYYVLTCHIYSGDPVISLFSTTPDGDNRLEVDLFERFPEEFTPLPALGHDLLGLFAGRDEVFIVVNSTAFNLVVVSVDKLGSTEVRAIIHWMEGRAAAASENGAKIAVSLNGGKVAAIDTVSNKVEFLSPTGTPPVVCRVQWVGNHTVLIDEVTFCAIRSGDFSPIKITSWTPATGEIEDLTGVIGGDYRFIIPLPDISELPIE